MELSDGGLHGERSLLEKPFPRESKYAGEFAAGQGMAEREEAHGELEEISREMEERIREIEEISEECIESLIPLFSTTKRREDLASTNVVDEKIGCIVKKWWGFVDIEGALNMKVQDFRGIKREVCRHLSDPQGAAAGPGLKKIRELNELIERDVFSISRLRMQILEIQRDCGSAIASVIQKVGQSGFYVSRAQFESVFDQFDVIAKNLLCVRIDSLCSEDLQRQEKLEEEIFGRLDRCNRVVARMRACEREWIEKQALRYLYSLYSRCPFNVKESVDLYQRLTAMEAEQNSLADEMTQLCEEFGRIRPLYEEHLKDGGVPLALSFEYNSKAAKDKIAHHESSTIEKKRVLEASLEGFHRVIDQVDRLNWQVGLKAGNIACLKDNGRCVDVEEFIAEFQFLQSKHKEIRLRMAHHAKEKIAIRKLPDISAKIKHMHLLNYKLTRLLYEMKGLGKKLDEVHNSSVVLYSWCEEKLMRE